MVEPISRNSANTVKVSAPSASTEIAHESTPVSGAKLGDAVELTITAQIRNLQRQGKNLQEIAMQLGMDTRTIQFLIGENA